MADKDDSGEKTEKPTKKRLRDARKRGQVAKSKELTTTFALLVWLLMGFLWGPFAVAKLSAFSEVALTTVARGEGFVLITVEAARLTALLLISLLVPMAVILGVVEFLQVGPLFAMKRLEPSMDRINPAEGLKRIFSTDNLVELLKSVIKTALVAGVAIVLVPLLAGSALGLPEAPAAATLFVLLLFCGALVGGVFPLFVLVGAFDTIYQRFSFTKKLRMSVRDIKQELKEQEGDPMLKGERREKHTEFAKNNPRDAARGATALVTNPTHVAVALFYDAEATPVPMVTAIEEGPGALLMRSEAAAAGVPIAHVPPLARALRDLGAVDDYVPEELYGAVAQVIVWAAGLRAPAAEAQGEEE